MEPNSILEAMLGEERADSLVKFISFDMVDYVDQHLGIEDELEVFDDAIDKCVSENPFIQLVQMSDDDAISELGMRIAVELEMLARHTEDAGTQAIRKRLASHYANWLMSVGPEEYEPEEEES